MNVRDLMTIIERVQDLQEAVTSAALSLSHGGSPATVANKKDDLETLEKELERLLDEEIPQ